MSNKYEDLIKNARMNAECGEHMSPEEVTTLLNVVETTFAALAAEVYDLKHPGTYLPSKRETPATDAFLAEVRAQHLQSYADSIAARMKDKSLSMRQKELLNFAWAEVKSYAAELHNAQLRKGVQS